VLTLMKCNAGEYMRFGLKFWRPDVQLRACILTSFVRRQILALTTTCAVLSYARCEIPRSLPFDGASSCRGVGTSPFRYGIKPVRSS